MKFTVYTIEFPDGNQYVGATCNYKQRASTHRYELRRQKGVNKRLQGAYDAHGERMKIYPVASAFNRESLHLVEQDVINALKPSLNVTKPNRIPATTEGCGKPYGPYASLSEFARAHGLTLRQAKYASYRFSYEATIYKLAYRKPEVKKATLTYNGETLTLKQWSELTGVSVGTMHQRKHMGWPTAEIIGYVRKCRCCGQPLPPPKALLPT